MRCEVDKLIGEIEERLAKLKTLVLRSPIAKRQADNKLAKSPPPPGFDEKKPIEAWTRDDLKWYCLKLGYVNSECIGKRTSDLREMVLAKESISLQDVPKGELPPLVVDEPRDELHSATAPVTKPAMKKPGKGKRLVIKRKS